MSITFSVADDFAGDYADLNVSNANGVELIMALGIGSMDDYWGEIPATALLAACDQLAAAPDSPAIAPSSGAGMLFGAYVPNMVECGRRQGYLQDRARALAEVAADAQRAGRAVVWS